MGSHILAAALVVLISLLPSILMVAGVGMGTGALVLWGRRFRYRKNPLTLLLFRTPGYTLQTQLDDLNFDISGLLLVLGLLPLTIACLHLSESYLAKMPETWPRAALELAVLVFAWIYVIRKLTRKLAKRSDLRLAYDAERATGQELYKLAPLGYHIYHDIPAGRFNVDHVLVGPTGVYAIETKGRSKRYDRPGKEGVKVIYDGDSLRFPGWVEKAPVEQAKNIAEWLSVELTRALGEQVHVKPVLCICGWYVGRTSKKPPIVYNGTKPESVFPKIKVQALTQQTIDRICYQLEQWVGDVEPSAYRVPEEAGQSQ